VKGITGESFVPESLILPQDIPALCDDLGLRTAVLAPLPTLDDSGVAVHQTGGRDPFMGSRSLVYQLGVPSPPVRPLVPVLPRPLAPWTRARGLQAVPPPQVVPGVEGGEAMEAASCRRVACLRPPRSARELLVGPRRPAPRLWALRGTSVLLCRRHHHPLGVITLRGTSNSHNNNRRQCSNSSRSGGRPTSRAAGKSRDPSKCSPSFP
jgi:hypothetical protein